MKTSIKLTLAALVILVVLPAVSLYINHVASRVHTQHISAVIDSLQTDTITVLQYRSPKASPGLLYVTPTRKERHSYIALNIQPEVRIAGDTLIITSSDPSAVYQGSVRLRHLREARFNERVRTLVTTPKVSPDSIVRDSVATDTLKVRKQILKESSPQSVITYSSATDSMASSSGNQRPSSAVDMEISSIIG